jgi:hypothetical protein
MTVASGRLYSDAPFSDLRYAYLSAIAKAWNSEEFFGQLVAAGCSGLSFLEEEFEFRFPWDIEFVMEAKKGFRPEWDPESGFLWRSGNHASPDEYVVPLPRLQEDFPGECLGPALAAYCRQFPTMLGKPGKPVQPVQPVQPVVIYRPLAEAPADFAAFGITTARVIAAVWRDPKMAQMLEDAYLDEEDGGIRTVQYVENWTERPFPWNFRLRFRSYSVETPVPKDLSDIPKWAEATVQDQPKTRIRLNSPCNPLRDNAEDYLIQPVALAAYNATGDAYPFTCA